jgi:hypothetical protein
MGTQATPQQGPLALATALMRNPRTSYGAPTQQQGGPYQQSYPPGMMNPADRMGGMQGKFSPPNQPSRATIQPIPPQQPAQVTSNPLQYMTNQRKGF